MSASMNPNLKFRPSVEVAVPSRPQRGNQLAERVRSAIRSSSERATQVIILKEYEGTHLRRIAETLDSAHLHREDAAVPRSGGDETTPGPGRPAHPQSTIPRSLDHMTAPLNCEALRDDIIALLYDDGELAERSRARDHLAACVPVASNTPISKASGKPWAAGRSPWPLPFPHRGQDLPPSAGSGGRRGRPARHRPGAGRTKSCLTCPFIFPIVAESAPSLL